MSSKHWAFAIILTPLAVVALAYLAAPVIFDIQLRLQPITERPYRAKFAQNVKQADLQRDALISVLGDELILKDHVSDCQHPGILSDSLACQDVSYAVFGSNLGSTALSQELLDKLHTAGYQAEALSGPNINAISKNGQGLGSISWDGQMRVTTICQCGFGPSATNHPITLPSGKPRYVVYYILTVYTPN